MSSRVVFDQAWIAQWRTAGTALARVRRDELAAMTATTALAASETLLTIGAATPLPADRQAWSGLVDLQRLLHRQR